MTSNFPQFLFVYLVLDLVSVCSSRSFITGNFNTSGFSSAVATWYGDPTGAGSGTYNFSNTDLIFLVLGFNLYKTRKKFLRD